MATEVNTFSSIVDDAIIRTGRPGQKADMISYTRQIIREMQSLGHFFNDLVEDQLVSDASPFIWAAPSDLRDVLTIQYPAILDTYGRPTYPKFIRPSIQQRGVTHFYYRSAGSYVFSAVDVGTIIYAAYYTWLPKLSYYDVAARPATYDLETDTWTYLTATTSTEQLAAQAQVTNWILQTWYDVVLEGVCSRVWKTVADPRAPSSFSLFSKMKDEFIRSNAPDSYSGKTS